MTALLLCEHPHQEAERLRKEGKQVAILEEESNREYAKKLYAELRRLDKEEHDVLVVERATAKGLGIAINDRLTKAAFGAPFPLSNGDLK